MRTLLVVTAIAALAACATADPDVVQRYETQRLAPVRDATVLAVCRVTIQGSDSGLGATSGAVAGGLAGSTVGGYHDSFIGLILGAIVGGVIGQAIELVATRENAVELLVQLRNGDRRSIVQAAGADRWQPGDAVVLVTSNGRMRVIRAPVPLAPPASTGSPVPQAAPPAAPVYPRTSAPVYPPRAVPVYPPATVPDDAPRTVPPYPASGPVPARG